jgi:scyllo-inositol 2-dehydrogenase (NADP+)
VKPDKHIRCAVIGYGGAYSMGKNHVGWINETPGLKTVAICDLDASRLAVAKEEFPEIKTYRGVGALLARADFDLAVIVTPHNTHAAVALQCIKGGKHVVLEKPMCITVKQCTEVIQAAKRKGVMLSVFHNRRWDGDYQTIREVVEKGVIGDVFQIEAHGGGWGHGGGWRRVKKISGGAFYDWGAHLVDWVLGLVPSKIESVTGFFHKLAFPEITNEDQARALVRFRNGCIADITISHLSRAPKPRWRILGTKGAIVDQGGGSFRLYGDIKGIPCESEVRYQATKWQSYYAALADHLLAGKSLVVTPESARRVIGVIEYAERSSKSKRPEVVPYE